MSDEINITAAESDWATVGDYVMINARSRGGPTYYRVTRLPDRRTAVLVLAPWYMRALLKVRDFLNLMLTGPF